MKNGSLANGKNEWSDARHSQLEFSILSTDFRLTTNVQADEKLYSNHAEEHCSSNQSTGESLCQMTTTLSPAEKCSPDEEA